MSMAQYKTAVTPLLMRWSYCSLALSHRYACTSCNCGRRILTNAICLHRKHIIIKFHQSTSYIDNRHQVIPKNHSRRTSSKFRLKGGTFIQSVVSLHDSLQSLLKQLIYFETNNCYGNGNAILTKFWSLGSPKVVFWSTFCAFSGQNFVKMAFPFHWRATLSKG